MNDKLNITQNNEKYTYQFNPCLQKWGWFCSNDKPELIVKKKGNIDIFPSGNDIIPCYHNDEISDNDKKLLLLSCLNESRIKLHTDFESTINSIRKL